MEISTPIAHITLFKAYNDELIPIAASISRPRLKDPGLWLCYVELGNNDAVPIVAGISLHALSLGIQHVRDRVEASLVSGRDIFKDPISRINTTTVFRTGICFPSDLKIDSAFIDKPESFLAAGEIALSQNERTSIYAAVGTPIEVDSKKWKCVSMVKGLKEYYTESIGQSSLESLCAAMRELTRTLKFLSKDSRISWPDNSDFVLDDIFDLR